MSILHSIIIKTFLITYITVMNRVSLSRLPFFELNRILAWQFILWINWLCALQHIHRIRLWPYTCCIYVIRIALLFHYDLLYSFIHTLYTLLLSVPKLRNWYFNLWCFRTLFLHRLPRLLHYLRCILLTEWLICRLPYTYWQVASIFNR